MLRKLRVSDFKQGADVPILAMYNGKNKYLVPGRMYFVTLNEKSGMGTVKQCNNPDMLHSNGGIQFPVSTFLIEEETKMVKFEDLSPEDQERLLEQARQMVDEEQIKKDAVNAYKVKRKDFVEQCLDEIYTAYHMRYETEKNAVKQRFVSMTNYLFKLKVNGKQYNSTNYTITNASEWNMFVKVNTAVKDMMISCYKED